MQKKLLGIAVAVALAPAAAFAQPAGTGVQIYGLLDFSVNHHKYDGDPTGTNVSKGEFYSNAGRFGLRGREALGMGLNGWFQAEIGVNPFRPEPNGGVGSSFFGGRDTAVGLEGGWGSVVGGIWGTPYKVANLATWNLGTYGLVSHYGIIMNNGDSTGTEPSPACSSNNAGTQICGNGVMAEAGLTAFGKRISNTVQYWTPTIGGFQGRIATQLTGHKAPSGTPDATNVDPGLWSVSLAWTTGAFALGAAWERHEDFTAVGAKDTAWMIGGKWTGGPFAIAGAIEQLEYDASGTNSFGNAFGTAGSQYERRNYVINATFNVGAGQLFAGYSWTPGNQVCGPTLVASAAAAGTDCETWTEAKMFSLGYAHNLSKRTKAYVHFANIENEVGTAYNFIAAPPGNAAGGTGGILVGTDQRMMGIGVQHSF